MQLGFGKSFNFWKHVFETVMGFADGGLRSTRLFFPSFIYGLLVDQGFVTHIDEVHTEEVDKLKIVSALLKGNRMLDLPWTATGVAPGVANTDPNSASTSIVVPQLLTAASGHTYVTLSTDFIHAQIKFAKEHIARYEEQVAELQLILDVATHSGQQEGDGIGNEAGDGGAEEETLGEGSGAQAREE